MKQKIFISWIQKNRLVFMDSENSARYNVPEVYCINLTTNIGRCFFVEICAPKAQINQR